MKKSKLISMQILAIVLVQVFSVAAFAAGVWSGPGATFQEWSFANRNSPMSPIPSDDSGAGNQYGTPNCYLGSRAVYGTNGGTWTLNTDEMDIYVPNNPNNNPQTRKDMQIEIEWMPGGGQPSLPGWPKRPLLSVYPEFGDGSVVIPDISILSQIQIPGAALSYKTIFEVTIEPNPTDEWVVLKGDIVVDHIAISTICTPEPATLGLLIGGAFMAIRRGRKKD
jgi:hypothetical protein